MRRRNTMFIFLSSASIAVFNACAPGDPPADDELEEVIESEDEVSGRAWQLPLGSSYWQKDFNVANSTLGGWSGCFNKAMSTLTHAGEDWANAAGTNVGAIGPGQVVYAAWANYPGYVVVVRHDLTSAEAAALGAGTSVVYSQYGHLGTLSVSAGANVVAGQKLGTVLDQGSNSHLHWEVRKPEKPQLCGYSYPGPGYTDQYTDARNWGYLDPSTSVSLLASTSAGTCDNNVPVGGTACAAQGETVEYVCTNPGAPSNQQWTAQACGAGEVCTGTGCAPTGQSWNCADSAWGSGQLWTCGGDDDRHKCQNGSPVEDDCDVRCTARASGQDDLCVDLDPTWSCATSAWGGAQYWTCSGGAVHRCEGSTKVKMVCPAGCQSMPYGQNDYCL